MPPPPPKQQQKQKPKSPDRNPDRNPDRTPERALPKEQQEMVAEMARGLEELRLIFEQYFMGNERVPPQEKRANYVGQLRRLKESGAIRNTVAKFQLNNLWSKYQTYVQMWNRILTQIEEGTYKRDRFKVGLRKKQVSAGPVPAEEIQELELEEIDFSVDEVDEAPVAPARPVAAAPAPPPMAARPAAPSPLAAPPRPGGPVPPAQPAGMPATFLQRGTAPSSAPGSAPATAAVGSPAMAPRPAVTPGVPGAAPRAQPAMGPVTSQPPRPAAAPNAAMPRPAAAAAPARPATAPAAAARPQGDISDDYLRRIERTLSDTRKKIGDATETNFDTLKAQLAKQVPLIKQQHGAKSVEFQVVVKDGKALLKAIPKK